MFAVLRGYRLEGSAVVHATRVLRAAVHGFVTLEAAGGFARAALAWAWPTQPGAWPVTLSAENVAGAFALGLLLVWLSRLEGPSGWRSPFFTIGVLGSLTTFSTLALDIVALGAVRPGVATAYAVVTVAAGALAAAAGWVLGARGRR